MLRAERLCVRYGFEDRVCVGMDACLLVLREGNCNGRIRLVLSPRAREGCDPF